jgi:hypothetical protein
MTLNDVTGWIRGTADTEGLPALSATGGALSINKMVQLKNLGAFSVELVPGELHSPVFRLCRLSFAEANRPLGGRHSRQRVSQGM